METLGPWPQVVDDIVRRLSRTTGDVAEQRASRKREFSRSLHSAADTLQNSGRFQADPFELRSFAHPRASRAVPPKGRFGTYTPNPFELHVRSRQLSIDYELSHRLPFTTNGVFVTRDTEGILYIYKPFQHEIFYSTTWLPHTDGQLAIREVAGYRVFELIDAPLVPPTALVDGPFGPGMAQLYVPLKRSKSAHLYPADQRARAALGHFLIGNADGSESNFRPGHDGTADHHPDDDLVVFDLGYSFPEAPDPLRCRNGIGEDFRFVSPFIDEWAGAEFPRHLLAPVDALTPDRLGSALQDLALSDNAIDNTLERLAYVRKHRTVHGNPGP